MPASHYTVEDFFDLQRILMQYSLDSFLLLRSRVVFGGCHRNGCRSPSSVSLLARWVCIPSRSAIPPPPAQSTISQLINRAILVFTRHHFQVHQDLVGTLRGLTLGHTGPHKTEYRCRDIVAQFVGHRGRKPPYGNSVIVIQLPRPQHCYKLTGGR